MTKPIVFELCAESLEACLSARPGGADRIELCSNLQVGGVTPAPELIESAVQQSGLPVHVLLLPEPGSFVYSSDIYAAVAVSLRLVRQLGAAGVVLGFLNADHTIDIDHTRALVEMAFPLEVSFHRGFDATPDLRAALEDIIATGCGRVLSSGGAPDVLSGVSALAKLVEQASERIEVAVAGGLTLQNAREIAGQVRARHYHASLRQKRSESGTVLHSLTDRIQAMTGILSECSRSQDTNHNLTHTREQLSSPLTG